MPSPSVPEPIPQEVMGLVLGKLAVMGVSAYKLYPVRQENSARWLVQVFDYADGAGYIWFWVQRWGKDIYEVMKIWDEAE